MDIVELLKQYGLPTFLLIIVGKVLWTHILNQNKALNDKEELHRKELSKERESNKELLREKEKEFTERLERKESAHLETLSKYASDMKEAAERYGDLYDKLRDLMEK